MSPKDVFLEIVVPIAGSIVLISVAVLFSTMAINLAYFIWTSK